MRVALITGASQGLGRALARQLAADGWRLVVDARHSAALHEVTDRLGDTVVAVVGDIADPAHRQELAAAVRRFGGGLDLLVNNASTLGPTPLPPLTAVTGEQLVQTFGINVAAPLELMVALLPDLRVAGGTVVSVSSDAAVEHYDGWGVYGSSKAAVDHLTLTLGAENSEIACYAFDPGDMRTAMQQAAFPGEDISDRPLPESVVPGLLNLWRTRPPSGRYRATDFTTAELPMADGVGAR